MMELDSMNTLNTPPHLMKNLDKFYDQIEERGIKNLYLTGTNTDPSLYKHHKQLTDIFHGIPGLEIGIRTNGSSNASNLRHYDNGSLTICSMDYHTNLKMMGGPPPDLGKIALYANLSKWNINTVLGPDNCKLGEVVRLIAMARKYGISYINLREPYGQQHIGIKVFEDRYFLGPQHGTIFEGTVPYWEFDGFRVYYWDVHFVGVNSINLYANGRISSKYSVTKGHSKNGKVQDQTYFEGHKRRNKQWIKTV